MITETLIDRPEYIRQLKSWQGQNDLIKIVTGARRSGKSKLLELFQAQLKDDEVADDSQIVSVNLEDFTQTREIGLTEDAEHFWVGYEKLLDYVLERLNPQKMNFVFIDEVQLLRDWQKVVNTLRLRKNVDVYLTGSNAYMFSSDLAKSLGGRYVEIKMQPLSFKEYYWGYPYEVQRTPEALMQVRSFQNTYTNYIYESGFPQTLKMGNDRQHISDYLRDTVYLNTIQKDIIKRFNLSDVDKLDAVVKYMFDNIGNETSVRNIERSLKAGGHKVSVPTIDRIIEGLLDSFLMYECKRYDIKGKQYLDSNSKYYVADIGLRTALIGMKDMDAGHILENVVYLELIRRGYEVSVGKIHSGSKMVEVDFVAKKSGGIVEYYQVALNVLGSELLERELTPLEAIADNYPKFLLTMDYGSGENNGIKRLNVLDWLLGQNQQSANMSMEIKIKQDELKDVLSEIAKLYLENREAAIKKLRELLDQALANDLNKIEADDKSSQKEKDILRFLYIRYYLSLQNDLNNEEFFINVLKGLKYGFKIANELSKQSNLIK